MLGLIRCDRSKFSLQMANVASAQLQKSAGQLALMVMRITSSKAGMMNVGH